MVKLEQIKRDGDYITCTAFLEDCKEPVQLVYSVQNDAVQYEALPSGYEYCVSHIGHIRSALQRMVKEGKIEPQKAIMWY